MYKSSENYKRAVRPLLMEDRVLAVEQKFFCDRTTEKTITLTVTDNQNTPLTLTNTATIITRSSNNSFIAADPGF